MIAKRLVLGKAARLDPAQALRLLYGLIATFEHHAGLQAVAYGQGVHPKHRHTKYHDFFIARVRTGETVVDIGCGNGALSYDIAARSGASVIGVDIESANIAAARARFPHSNAEYRLGDARQAVDIGSADVIILSNVLEHLSGRDALLRDLTRRLSPARFLIRVPLFERDWTVPLRKELGLEWRCDPTHEIEYTLETFAEEMWQAELTVVHQEVRWGEIWAEAVPSRPA
ncbi:MAG: class I SAM-dependent methyltransferase [Rhodospirillales bacterium]|nr:class I SAM-dependent methyltransferase [Rhodospirillales bacterium]